MSVRTEAQVSFSIDLVRRNVPWAPAPRACTTRSGMRSWSKCMIFSRRWKSSSRVGPRSPTRRLLSVSSTGTPVAVVSVSPPWAHWGDGVVGSARRDGRLAASGGGRGGRGGLCHGVDLSRATGKDVRTPSGAEQRYPMAMVANGPIADGARCTSCVSVHPFARVPFGYGGGTTQRRVFVSATDKAKDKAQVAKGHVKEAAGKATAPGPVEAEGKGDKVAGNLKQAGEKLKDAVKK